MSPTTLQSTVSITLAALVALGAQFGGSALAQPLGEPDRASPGDVMIQAYLQREAERLSEKFAEDVQSLASWQAKRPQYRQEYYYMLGLSPLPEKSPLEANVTGTLTGDGYVVDMLHYQSRPGLYVTGNLYRPASIRPGEKLPAVLYVCGHSNRGRNGNKVAYQSHGIWFARHGYICLVVDSLQLGEIAATHHGTYNLNRWWWHSRGYTPAGVEALNGIRGIDYLASRADVDAARIAVTGISGGGAATFWIAAADERVAAAVPVSGMADLNSYVPNRVINGHCDCMFLYNTFQWPWTRIASLVAPRPMLFANSDQDRIFPMDANERISNRLERTYSLYGAGDRCDTIVSVGGHAYRQDLRQGIYRYLNAELKGDARTVRDSEIDIVSEGSNPGAYPIAPEKLRVFKSDGDLPADQLNTKIDEHFVPLAKVSPPTAGQYAAWKEPLVAELRRVSFGYFPETIPAARKIATLNDGTDRLESEPGIEFRMRYLNMANASKGVLLAVLNEDEAGTTPEWLKSIAATEQAVALCEPRGIGGTRWSVKHPPNYVARSHALLGRTVETGRMWDLVAAAKYLASKTTAETKVTLQIAGKGRGAALAAYAALLDEGITSATLISPPMTQMDAEAPPILNVLRVCDLPIIYGMLAPRELTIRHGEGLEPVARIYQAADASTRLKRGDRN